VSDWADRGISRQHLLMNKSDDCISLLLLRPFHDLLRGHQTHNIFHQRFSHEQLSTIG
jgi:hypothetical protein